MKQLKNNWNNNINNSILVYDQNIEMGDNKTNCQKGLNGAISWYTEWFILIWKKKTPYDCKK